jgi:hypothetical protein
MRIISLDQAPQELQKIAVNMSLISHLAVDLQKEVIKKYFR